MQEIMPLLQFHGIAHSAHLHAKGALATRVLVHELGCQKGENVLEIGFGTGATLACLAAKHPQTNFFGVDILPVMLEKAAARLAFCGLRGRAKLQVIETAGRLPFGDQFFDKIYAESVLAIQEGEQLEIVVAEIARTLKPAGKLVLNETLWLPTTTADEIESINQNCKNRFGIIQCNAQHPRPENWKTLLAKHGLTVTAAHNLNETDFARYLPPPVLHRGLSRVFTLWGKLAAKIRPDLRRAQQDFEAKTVGLMGAKKYMEGMVLVARKA